MGLARLAEERRRREEEEEKRRRLAEMVERQRNEPDPWSGELPARSVPVVPPPPPPPVQGPPERLPRPSMRPQVTVPEAPPPMQLSRPEVDTSAPMIGATDIYAPTQTIQRDEPDVSSQRRFGPPPAPEPLPNPWQNPIFGQPQERQTGFGSLSDRLRGEYQAPQRPLVPTAPRPFGVPEVPQPQVPQPQVPQPRYDLQSDEPYEGEHLRRQILAAQPQPIQNRIVQGIGQAAGDFANWWVNTPEYRLAQERTQDRREHDPNFLNDVMTGIGIAGGLSSPFSAAAGATMGAFVGALNQTDWGRELVIRGQDVMDRVFEVPGAIAANTPIAGLPSIAEFVTPTVSGTVEAIQQLPQFIDPTSIAKTNQNLLNWLTVYTGQQIARTQDLRKQVQQQVEQGNKHADLALRNMISGADSVENTLDLLVNREARAQQLEQMAMQVQDKNPVLASEYFLQAQELREMSNAEAVDSQMNPLAEFAYGILLDPTNVVGPLLGVLGLTTETRVLRQAKQATQITPAQAIEKLAQTVKRGQDLTRAVAEGPKVARETYKGIIAPFQGTTERVQDMTWLFARTPESRAALDTEYLWQGLAGILSGITNKQDIQIILETLLTQPGKLVEGINNLSQEAMQRLASSDGFARWGAGLVGQNDFVRRIPLLATIRDELTSMRSLSGQGMVNPYEFYAELHGYVLDAARRANGARPPGRLPFGASKVDVMRLGPDSAVVVYLDRKGNVIQRGTETTVTEAQRRVNAINEAIQNTGKRTALDWARIPADIQRAIMSDIWLGMRPANWLGNALGATTMLFGHDAYTLIPNRTIQDYFGKKFGGVMPNLRLQEGVNSALDLTRDAKAEISSGAIDTIARFITRDPNNPISRIMRALYDIPYGSTEIQLPGGLAIPFGEGAFYSRAFYVPFKRAFDAGIVQSINQNLVPVLQQIEGMTPQMIQQVGNWVVTLAQNGSRSDVAEGIRKLVGKPEIKMTLKDLGVLPEVLSPEAARAIEWLIADASPSEAMQVMEEISRILNDERNLAASVLTITPGQPGITDWTDVDMAQEAAWIADNLVQDATKAGLDPSTAKQEATSIVTDFLKQQQDMFNRITQDLAASPNTPDIWSVVMDFWHDLQRSKTNARAVVDELGQRAVELGTPQAWTEKWEGTKRIYDAQREHLANLAEQTRLALQDVLNGGTYTPRHDWWETIENYMKWDEEAFRESRTIQLGTPSAEDIPVWQEAINRNREYLDNSIYELFGAFQRFPSLENFDVVRHGIERIETMGAEVAFKLSQLRQMRAAGTMTADAYNYARNMLWNKFFDDSVTLNNYLGKHIIRNGIIKDTVTGLRWQEGDITWELVGPSDIPGKWKARNVATGTLEEFSTSDAGEATSPFVVPKEVLDDYNRLLGNEVELDKAADAVMQDIVQSAPERTSPLFRIGDRLPGEPFVIMQEPETAPRIPGYDDPAAVRAEPLPEEIPAAGDMPRPAEPPSSTPYSQEPDIPRKTGYSDEPTIPQRTGYSKEPAPTPTPRYSIPTNNDIRKTASDAGIATITDKGRPTDRHLINSLNKRMGIKIKKLDDLTEEQRIQAVRALQARKEEQISRMSPAEAQQAVQEAAPTVEPTPTSQTENLPGGLGRLQGTSITPTTPSMFAETGEDLPLISGAAPRVSTLGDAAKAEIKALKEARAEIRKAWDRDVSAAVQRATGDKRNRSKGLAGIDAYVRTYSREGAVNLVGKGGKVFEDLYGRTIGGRLIESDYDLERYLQEYVDLQRQIEQLEAIVAKSRQFKKMSVPEIIESTRDELLAAGLSPEEVEELKTLDRRTVLDTIESIRGETPDEPGMVAYDFAVPSISHVLALEDKANGFRLWHDWLNRSRRTGNNGAVPVADVAKTQIRNINELEQTLRKQLPEILRGQPNQLTGAQRLKVVDAVLDWLPEYDNNLAIAQRVGDRMAGWLMLNYQDRRNFDTIVNLLMIPYHYFWSRMPSRTLMMSLQKPGLVNAYYETVRAIESENEQAGVPERLQGTLPIPGTNARINAGAILRYVIPYSSYGPSPYVEEDPEATGVKKWINFLQKWNVPLGPLTLALADFADNAKFDNYYGDVLNSLMPIPGPGMGAPISSVYQALTGKMPAREGVMASVGFGPDTADDGFPLDVYRARRATGWIAEQEGISPDLLGYAQQVIINQYNGVNPTEGIPLMYQQPALELAERGIRQAAEDRIMGRTTAYNIMMAVQPWTAEEQEMTRANRRYWASGYDPQLNRSGSQQLRRDLIEADPTLERHWIKNSDTPAVDVRLGDLYDRRRETKEQMQQAEQAIIEDTDISRMPKSEINALKEEARTPYEKELAEIDKQIEQLEKQQVKRNSGDGTSGMSPEERERERIESILFNSAKIASNPGELPPGASEEEKEIFYAQLEQYNEQRKQFVIDQLTQPIVSEAERRSGRKQYTVEEAERIWEDHLNRNRTEKEIERRAILDARQDILNQHDAYWDIPNDNYEERLAYLQANPDFADAEAERYYEKYGELPWWADDLGISVIPGMELEGPAKPSEANQSQRTDKQPEVEGAVSLIGRRLQRGEPYGTPQYIYDQADEYWAIPSDDWDARLEYLRTHPEFAEYELNRYRNKYNKDPWWYDDIYGEGSGKGGSQKQGGSGSEWSAYWDEYHNLSNTAAKRQYLLDNPEFAEEYLRYIREQDPEAEAWWLKEYTPRVYSSSYGGYGGYSGGGGGGFNYRNARVDPRFFNPQLWQGPRRPQWRPYFNATPGWLQAGRELAPEPIRRWIPPRWS